MDIPSFLYRRLSRYVTSVLRVPGGGELRLDDKFQQASFQGVFLEPNYWRIFTLFDTAPGLVVDCGAHCGHFTVLTEICLRQRFGEVGTRYILVEPNARLQAQLHRNLRSTRIADRAKVIRGALGPKRGTAFLETQARNLLVSSLGASRTGQAVDCVDLAEHVGERQIDPLKLDIEGGEFVFLKHNPDIFDRTRAVVADVHLNVGTLEAFDAVLSGHGFTLLPPVMEAYGNRMVLYRRASA